MCVKMHGLNAIEYKIIFFKIYKKYFLSGYVKAMKGNSGLKKSRQNTIAIVGSINKIVE